MPALITGVQAPTFSLPDLHGHTVDLSDQLQRGPVVLAFFKISCPICQYAFPYLERLHQAYPDAAIFGISQNSAKDTERFCREFGVTFPVLLDDPKNYAASNAYGLTNVPSIFYIAPDGAIEVSCVGWSRKDVEEIGRRLASARKQDPVPLFRGSEQVTDFRAG
ncbi:MAG: peroxiredoxin family protein [Terriglobales bacterium]